jgi:Ca2+-transporting ATPase
MKPVYQLTTEAVVRTLRTDAVRGLSTVEARSRLARYGLNHLQEEHPVPGWKKFLAQFRDVLVMPLLIATAISFILWVYERDSVLPYEAIAISAVVLLNAILGSSRSEPNPRSRRCARSRRRTRT